MTITKLANEDYERAISRGFWRKVTSLLTRRSNRLLPFDEVREHLPIKGQHYLGLQQVEIEKIVGSQGRYRDFDRAFLPIQTHTKGRWVSVDQAHLEHAKIPPIDLYKIGDIYFVKDGNHRVSVAREKGQEFIDAFVTEIEVPVLLTVDTEVDDLEVKREHANFLLQTHLQDHFPDVQFETMMPGQYEKLMEHIAFHRWLLDEREEEDVTLETAAISWYEHVYKPIVDAIREQDLLKELSGITETDLYLWLIKYQWYLRGAYKYESHGDLLSPKAAKKEAGRQLSGESRQPVVRKLVNVLKHADWMDEWVLKQERNAFIQETQLDVTHPEAKIEASLPGQYEKLSEHISVHRWYLGEQRHAEVPYHEAALSWYDQVYRPLVELIREQGILAQFPGKSETDLYLWVIEEQADLKNEYGDDVSLEEAARQLADDHP